MMAAAQLHTRPVGIIGGMGPAAGADFVRLFVDACNAYLTRGGFKVIDQAYPEHWLVQVPVPDRTEALCNGHDAPLPALQYAVERLQTCGANAVAIACNTAHAWHAKLQQKYPQLELLPVAREVARLLKNADVKEVGLMATQGTYRIALYDTALTQAGIVCHCPLETERETLMRGIYQGVKTGDLAYARACFVNVAQRLQSRHGDLTLIMGCTEIPLALENAPEASHWRLLNPAQVLAQALAERAYN